MADKKKVAAGVGLVGGVAALPVAVIGAISLIIAIIVAVVAVMSGALGAMFADKNVQQQYGYFGCGGTTTGGDAVPATQNQTGYVRTMIGVAKSMNVSEQGQIVAAMVMLQESTIQNYANDGTDHTNFSDFPSPGKAYWLNLAKGSMAFPHDAVGSDADSIGLFQQRASSGWADDATYHAATGDPSIAVKRLLDPRWSSQMFFGGPGGSPDPGLLDISGWESMEPTVAAQTVQGSAYGGAYAKWQSQATALVSANQDAPALPLLSSTTTTTTSTGGASTDPDTDSLTTGASCANGVPGISITASGDIAPVLAAGVKWLGLPYSWGGGTLTGPSDGFDQGAGIVGFDCSSLVRYMYYQGTGGKVTLPRVAQDQYDATKGNPVQFADLQPGDLLFWGTAGNLHHVAMWYGDGKIIEEPHTGSVAHIVPFYGGDYFGATRVLNTTNTK